jgi:Flp pilus assembly pilin Flp
VKQLMRSFVREESGQDLVEYSLLLAFVVLASAALFLGAGQSITGIWTVANTKLTDANSRATSNT